MHRLAVVAYVPNLDSKVVSRENVIVRRWSEFSLGYRVDYVREEVLSGGTLPELEEGRGILKLRTHSEITVAHVALAGGK